MKEHRGWGEKTHTTVQTIIAVLNQTRIIKYMYIYKETSPGDIRDDRCLTSDWTGVWAVNVPDEELTGQRRARGVQR